MTSPRGQLPAPEPPPGRPWQARLRYGSGAGGVERLEAELVGSAFAPHSHDTYAIGVTLAGVQTFSYRNDQRVCLPGEAHILHPDVPHDGRPGTDAGFRYRIIYLSPVLVQEALGGQPLPFVADPVVTAARLPVSLVQWVRRMDEPLSEIEVVELTVTATDLLRALAGPRTVRRQPIPLARLLRVRDLIADDPTVHHSAATLEAVAGLDRWSVARYFRAAFGTSPTRFRTMRQLDLARAAITAGATLAEAAARAGFADQSHFTRMFARTYGLPPGRWAAATRRHH
ncbi:AraC family transcriptional regulator [Georgenia sp. TF02-10]|uniref:AraC family transcriptional regulator n=1 Tax=Georgenia sp. TF02-10 TaxID=2917725 RepID=UPI001FA6DA73|nr:AraC family transcriptional regulator [Georgenia sp. TF02-10]UNX53165.1 AraC family transcriptional regulator [Georgenia sp. TF02-10]